MRFLEVILICAIAFGPSLYLSVYSLFDNDFENTPRTSYAWAIQLLREGCYLGLLWYVLSRRGQFFSDLGLKWSWKDLVWSIILFLVGSVAFQAIYTVIRFSGLGSLIYHEPYVSVSYLLFGGGIFLSTLLFQFLNPFFEELIVRAYLMTEIKYFTNSSAWAIIISTVLQSSYHLYQGVPAAISHVGTFLIFSIYYAKTKRITPIILAHLYMDVGATLHYWVQH
jgi:membrane protease YdiL (CAAX protease family)